MSATKWDVFRFWRNAEVARRHARAVEVDALRRPLRELDPPTEREYWQSLTADDSS